MALADNSAGGLLFWAVLYTIHTTLTTALTVTQYAVLSVRSIHRNEACCWSIDEAHNVTAVRRPSSAYDALGGAV